MGGVSAGGCAGIGSVSEVITSTASGEAVRITAPLCRHLGYGLFSRQRVNSHTLFISQPSPPSGTPLGRDGETTP